MHNDLIYSKDNNFENNKMDDDITTNQILSKDINLDDQLPKIINPVLEQIETTESQYKSQSSNDILKEFS